MAVVTVAICRTWPVRLEAIEFTDSVRSFHVPATPGTRAWPPSSPSVPTSRATRVTSEENEDSWSTIVLTVFFSWSISPATWTVTFRDRSPLATAVVTSAMSRTWAVSRYAMVFTESVRSFQDPDIPRTCAWPPSLPSVPTSTATRVTCSVKTDSWSTRLLTVRATFRNSPRNGRTVSSCVCERSSIRCSRSPSATADSTRPTSETGRARSSTSSLEASIAAAQEPSQAPVSSRSVSLPSRPTTRRTRASSPVR
ncbi:Ig-like domain-containing protein OS=Streptomyces griseus OX=1911 GN=NCTC7807_01621 PE=4 SV=1 [Streptomyces griseus subsp. griseus]